MDIRQQLRQCEARLHDLDLPVPFSVRPFCRSLSARRGRRIFLRPVASKAGPCGLWVAGPTADFIFYEQETSPLHQDHIILHEVCHLLCGHRPAPVSEGELSRLLFPHLGSAMVQRVLARAGYSGNDEREAELLASLILERANVQALPAMPGQDAATKRIIDRLEASLEERLGG